MCDCVCVSCVGDCVCVYVCKIDTSLIICVDYLCECLNINGCIIETKRLGYVMCGGIWHEMESAWEFFFFEYFMCLCECTGRIALTQ